MGTPHGGARLPKGQQAKLLKWLGGPVQRRIARWSLLLQAINGMEPLLQNETDQQLRKRSLSLRFRAKSGERLERLLPEAYA
ncbi:MAG: preprotein translocase subunit SecA, partial [Planctomycetes bacterium]|nr:preprotein translocase subunit SecA [Planctomycetota bacterium]